MAPTVQHEPWRASRPPALRSCSTASSACAASEPPDGSRCDRFSRVCKLRPLPNIACPGTLEPARLCNAPAMTSRCYGGRLRFVPPRTPAAARISLGVQRQCSDAAARCGRAADLRRGGAARFSGQPSRREGDQSPCWDLGIPFQLCDYRCRGAPSNGLLTPAIDRRTERPRSAWCDQQRPLHRRWCRIADDSGNRGFLWSTCSPGGEGCESKRRGFVLLTT